MKKVMTVLVCVLAVAAMLSTSGCAGCDNDLKHMRSEFIGLNRHITLYANDGKIIKEWDTQAQVQNQGGSCNFLVNGKMINIAGTYLIEEK